MIPRVKTWIVKGYDDAGKLIKTVEVRTINKRFARWIANTELGMYHYYLTVSVKRDKPCPECIPARDYTCGECINGAAEFNEYR